MPLWLRDIFILFNTRLVPSQWLLVSAVFSICRLVSSQGLIISFYIVGCQLITSRTVLFSRLGFTSSSRTSLFVSRFRIFSRWINVGWFLASCKNAINIILKDEGEITTDLYLDDFLILGIARLYVFFFDGLACFGRFPAVSLLPVFSML